MLYHILLPSTAVAVGKHGQKKKKTDNGALCRRKERRAQPYLEYKRFPELAFILGSLRSIPSQRTLNQFGAAHCIPLYFQVVRSRNVGAVVLLLIL